MLAKSPTNGSAFTHSEPHYAGNIGCIYSELNKLAKKYMRNERPGHTLEPGALVNEAFLKLAQEQLQGCSRRQVTAMFARSMREILVDHARRKAALKRGGDARQITLNNDDIQPAGDLLQDDLLALDYALNALANEHPRLGDIVQMRYFLGLTIDEVADTLQVSPATVKRDWLYARAWLYERLSI